MKKLFIALTIATVFFSFTGIVFADAHLVKIIELDNRKECVLIKNEGKSAVNLKGWQLHDHSKNKSKKYTYTFTSLELKPGQILQMQSGISKKKQKEKPNSAKLENADHYILWSNGRVWNDDGDTAYLRDSTGKLIDEKKGGKNINVDKKK